MTMTKHRKSNGSSNNISILVNTNGVKQGRRKIYKQKHLKKPNAEKIKVPVLYRYEAQQNTIPSGRDPLDAKELQETTKQTLLGSID